LSKDTAIKSYQVVGKVEDMTDFITALDPDQTLLTNKFGKATVTSTEHSWLCDALRPAKINKTLESVDFETANATPRKRASNYTQQFLHGYTVTDTTQAIKKYGVRDEAAYQMVKASKEVGRDLELALVANSTKVLGDDATAGQFGGLPYFLTNFQNVTVGTLSGIITLTAHKFVTGDAVILAATALDANYKPNIHYFVHVIDADTFTIHDTAVDAEANTGAIIPASAQSGLTLTYNNAINAANFSTAGKFTFEGLNDAMQAAWKRGGSIDCAIMSGKNKRIASGFTDGVTKTRPMEAKTVVSVVDVIETDFGRIDLLAHRLYEDDVVDLLELQYWKLGYLIPFHVESVPRKGTYQEKVITGSATLECTAPTSSARIYGITG